MFAHTSDINRVRSLPPTGELLDGTGFVLALPSADAATQAACGWLPVTVEPQPTYDAATERLERTATSDGATITHGWQIVAKTQDELDAAAATADRQQKQANVTAAPAVLRAGVGTPVERLAILEETLADLIESGVL